jgi:hypothetical protein
MLRLEQESAPAMHGAECLWPTNDTNKTNEEAEGFLHARRRHPTEATRPPDGMRAKKCSNDFCPFSSGIRWSVENIREMAAERQHRFLKKMR